MSRTDVIDVVAVVKSGKITVGGGTPQPTAHAVNVAAGITGGTVVSDKAEAADDETVTLTVTPSADKELDTLTVAKADGTVSTVKTDATHYTFTMPDEAVTVSAVFKDIGGTTPPAAGFTVAPVTAATPTVGDVSFDVDIKLSSDPAASAFASLKAEFTYDSAALQFIGTAPDTKYAGVVVSAADGSGKITRIGDAATAQTVADGGLLLATLQFKPLAPATDSAITVSGAYTGQVGAGEDDVGAPAAGGTALVTIAPAEQPPADEDYVILAPTSTVTGAPDGYTLLKYVVPTLPAGGKGYAYNGSDMFYSEKLSTANAHVFLYYVPDTVTDAAAKAAIAESAAIVSVHYDGRVNNDEIVDVFDAQIVYDLANGHANYAADFTALGMANRLAADIDGDGEITPADARAIQNYIHYGTFAG
ncbi:MAG: dockerin type I domain-containing protein [Clostridiales Family XIII bacterium]|nr:dockerin type I domain-containing protein [Clostridiales Family XIII bacterium]